MPEAQRLCLGCHNKFKSSSASNRFCKTCKKKSKKLKGTFMALDTSCIPQHISTTINERYYATPKPSLVIYKSQTEPAPVYRHHQKTLTVVNTKPKKKPRHSAVLRFRGYSEWGPPYPADI